MKYLHVCYYPFVQMTEKCLSKQNPQKCTPKHDAICPHWNGTMLFVQKHSLPRVSKGHQRKSWSKLLYGYRNRGLTCPKVRSTLILSTSILDDCNNLHKKVLDGIILFWELQQDRLECDLEYFFVFNCGAQAYVIRLRTEMQQRVCVLSTAGGYITAIVVNPPENKLAKRTSV